MMVRMDLFRAFLPHPSYRVPGRTNAILSLALPTTRDRFQPIISDSQLHEQVLHCFRSMLANRERHFTAYR